MGGVEIGQQYIGAGLVDGLMIHLVLILLGAGTPMFENLGDAQTELELDKVVRGKLAAHLRVRVVNSEASGR